MPDAVDLAPRTVNDSRESEWNSRLSARVTDLPNRFEAIVIGAGPAGAMAALLLARSGIETLLVERNIFPRYKVCGCCLSPAAIAILEEVGLKKTVEESGSIGLSHLRVHSNSHFVQFPLTGSQALSRERFDAMLVENAIAAGTTFVHGATAHIERTIGGQLAYPPSQAGGLVRVAVTETNGGRLSPPMIVESKVVIVADGLSGSSLYEFPELASVVATASRIGSGTISTEAPEFYRAGIIYMAYGQEGYLGLVRLEDGRTDIGAAIDANFLRANGGLHQAAARLLDNSGLPRPADLERLPWKGTAGLTRRRPRMATERVFVVGDAAAYVEPFTGEGIAWALASARAVIPFARQTISGWHPLLIDAWEREHRITVGRKQRSTRMLSAVLRHQRLAGAVGKLVELAPPVSSMLVGLVGSSASRKRN